ncbi:hypothetical protein TNCV_3709021 [Trichonephila clavipes]|nr:hypothetical protein TNCV_3709021 [Trichonephila clavipes]
MSQRVSESNQGASRFYLAAICTYVLERILFSVCIIFSHWSRAWERVTLFGGVKETHSPNSVSCKQQEQGRCKNFSCNFRDRRPPITSKETKQTERRERASSDVYFQIILVTILVTREQCQLNYACNIHVKVGGTTASPSSIPLPGGFEGKQGAITPVEEAAEEI